MTQYDFTPFWGPGAQIGLDRYLCVHGSSKNEFLGSRQAREGVSATGQFGGAEVSTARARALRNPHATGSQPVDLVQSRPAPHIPHLLIIGNVEANPGPAAQWKVVTSKQQGQQRQAKQRPAEQQKPSTSAQTDKRSHRHRPPPHVPLLLIRGGVEENPGPAAAKWQVVNATQRQQRRGQQHKQHQHQHQQQQRQPQPEAQQQQRQQQPEAQHPLASPIRVVDGVKCRVPLRQVGADEVCWRCGRPGHYAANCSQADRARSTPPGAPGTWATVVVGNALPRQGNWISRTGLCDVPAWVLRVQGEQLLDFSTLVEEQDSAWAALSSAFFAVEATRLSCLPCPWGCGQQVPAWQRPQHLLAHAQVARDAYMRSAIAMHKEAWKNILQLHSEGPDPKVMASWAEKKDHITSKDETKRLLKNINERQQLENKPKQGHQRNDKMAKRELGKAPKRSRIDLSHTPQETPPPTPPPTPPGTPAATPRATHNEEDEEGICVAKALAEAFAVCYGKPYSVAGIKRAANIEHFVPNSPVTASLFLLRSAKRAPVPLQLEPSNNTIYEMDPQARINPCFFSAVIVEGAELPPQLSILQDLRRFDYNLCGLFLERGGHIWFAKQNLPNEEAQVIAGTYVRVADTEAQNTDRDLPFAFLSDGDETRTMGCGMCVDCGGFSSKERCDLCAAILRDETRRSSRKKRVPQANEETDDDTQSEETDDDTQSEEASGGDSNELSDEEGRDPDTRAHRFATDSREPARRGAMCPVALCGYTPNLRFGPEIVRHANTIHDAPSRSHISNEDLAKNGVTRCNVCNELVAAPAAARNTHRCGQFIPRAERIRRNRDAFVSPRGIPPQPLAVGAQQAVASDQIVVWTDGSAGPNGVGVGVFFAPGDCRNRSLSIPSGTNQLAELAAAVEACRITSGPLFVNTDSQWLIDGATGRNATLGYDNYWGELGSHRHRLTFRKVDAHSGVWENECADTLAKLASLSLTREQAKHQLEGFYGAQRAHAASDAMRSGIFCEPSSRPLVAHHEHAAQTVSIEAHRDYNPTSEDWEFLSARPRTIRSLHRRQFKEWNDAVMSSVLAGYSASAPGERFRRQLLWTETPRKLLSRPTRNATTGNDGHDHTSHKLAGPIRRAEQMVILGANGKAARALADTDTSAVPLTDEIIQQIVDLHPPEPPEEPAPPSGIRVAPTIAITAQDVARAVKKKLARGSAPGPDGWTRELLIPLVEDQRSLNELTALITDLIGARIHPGAAWRLRSTAGMALSKPGSGAKIRPIEPENATVKLACSVAKAMIRKDWLDNLQPLQQGVGGNVESTARDIVSSMPSSECTVLLDCVNAFGSLARAAILNEVFAEPALGPIHALTTWLLAPPAEIAFYEGSRIKTSVRSTRGVRQGMLLGPLYFAVGIHKKFLALQEAHPDITFILYLDDITIRGSTSAVEKVLPEVFALLQSLGLRVNILKSLACFSNGVVPQDILNIPKASGIVRVLGAGVALDDGMVLGDWLFDKVKAKTATLFDTLNLAMGEGDVRLRKCTALRILRSSALPRLNFVIRTHRPEDSMKAAEWFDNRVRETLGLLIGADVQPASLAHEIAALPAGKGGMGLRIMARTAPLAHAATEKGAQKKAQALADNQSEQQVHTMLSQQQIAWMRSSARANQPFYHEDCIIEDKAFVAWSRQRLFIRVASPAARCHCGQDATNQHVLTCGRLLGNPRIFRHDAVVNTLAAAMTTFAGGLTQVEPTAGQSNSARPDIIRSTAVARYATDVTIATPGVLGVCSALPLAAASAAEKRKNQQWHAWAAARGLDFSPFAMEATGALPSAASAWVRRCVEGPWATQASQAIVASCVRSLLNAQLAIFAAIGGVD